MINSKFSENKMKRYGTALKPHEKTRVIYKSKRSPQGHQQGYGIPLLVKSFKSPQIKKSCMCKIILLLAKYYQKCTCNKPLNTKTNL